MRMVKKEFIFFYKNARNRGVVDFTDIVIATGNSCQNR